MCELPLVCPVMTALLSSGHVGDGAGSESIGSRERWLPPFCHCSWLKGYYRNAAGTLGCCKGPGSREHVQPHAARLDIRTDVQNTCRLLQNYSRSAFALRMASLHLDMRTDIQITCRLLPKGSRNAVAPGYFQIGAKLQ